MTLRFLRQTSTRLLAAFLFALLVYVVALHFRWFSTLDRKVYDLGLGLRPSATEILDAALVGIDRNSLAECFPEPAFPVARHLKEHARVIERLDAAGAALIVLDLLFDSLDNIDPADVSRFAAVLERTGKVVLAAAIEKVAQPETGSALVVTTERLALPPPGFRSASAGLGLVNMPLDADSYVRRCYLTKPFRDRSYRSLSHEAARLYQRRDAPFDGDNPFYIDYGSFSGAVRRIPYVSVLDGGGWESAVANKVVVVGVVENGSIDTYRVPLSDSPGRSEGKMSGALIQAVAIQTLLSGTMIRQVSPVGVLGLGVLVLIIVTLTLSRIRPVPGLGITFAVLMLLIVGALLSTSELSLVFPVGALLLSVVGAALAMFTANLIGLRGVTETQQEIITDMRDDLDTAHIIYENLQPREFHLDDNIQISAMQIPRKEVGGDYYDITTLPDGRIGVLIADVAGKGVSGSLIMSNLQGHFRHAAPKTLSPAAMLREFNESVGQVATSQARFVTLFYGVLDCKNLVLTYSNAGHCHPILCSPDGQTRTLTEGGPLLGPFPGLEWPDSIVTLRSGDVLCLYTDGITEAGGDDPQRQFGQERIIACLKEKRHEPAEAIKTHLYDSCRQFARETFDDDWTLLILKMGRA